MDMISNTSNISAAAFASQQNHHQQAMVASPPALEAERRNGKEKEQTRAQQGAWIVGGERKPQPLHNEALKCPRCDSTNTKFCYYNNYSTTQPRYFCKACRRYWTQGGTLRNVPVGGHRRKNKHTSEASSSSSPAATSSFSSSTIINNSMQQLMMMMPTTAATTMVPNLLPKFMSSTTTRDDDGFKEHLHLSPPFVPLTLSSNDAADESGMMSSFLDILNGGTPGGINNNGNGTAVPFSLSPFDAMPMNGHGMGTPTPHPHVIQLVGPLQGVGNGTIGYAGLQQWQSSQHGSINNIHFAAGSSSPGVQQNIASDHDAHHHDNKTTVMDYWTNSDDDN